MKKKGKKGLAVVLWSSIFVTLMANKNGEICRWSGERSRIHGKRY
jgi:hypothetical protein